MALWFWLMATLAVVVTAEHGKVKRQIYYSDDIHRNPRPTYQEPSRPTYQEPARPSYSRPSRPTYEEPIRDTYEDEGSLLGVPGKDYPIYNEVPYTKFSCADVPYRPGIYANPEAGCQVYHVCDDERYGPQGAQFLCTNGTLFNQEVFTCDWWYNVDCSKATSFYGLNTDEKFNPFYQKPYEGPLNTPAPYGSPEVYDKPDPYRPAPPRNQYYQ